MVEEKDIDEALKTINQNMLLNKKKVDIDNIVESIVLFFNNYFITLSIDVTDKICNSKNISILLLFQLLLKTVEFLD